MPTSRESAPLRCADVTWQMRGKSPGMGQVDADVGDLLWNPKAGAGHVLVAEVPCGGEYDCGCGGWGAQPCPSTTLLCECGEDNSWRDHHYEILARRVP